VSQAKPTARGKSIGDLVIGQPWLFTYTPHFMRTKHPLSSPLNTFMEVIISNTYGG
jgi:hypothetical protein